MSEHPFTIFNVKNLLFCVNLSIWKLGFNVFAVLLFPWYVYLILESTLSHPLSTPRTISSRPEEVGVFTAGRQPLLHSGKMSDHIKKLANFNANNFFLESRSCLEFLLLLYLCIRFQITISPVFLCFCVFIQNIRLSIKSFHQTLFSVFCTNPTL